MDLTDEEWLQLYRRGGEEFAQAMRARFIPSPGIYSLDDGRTLEVTDEGVYRTTPGHAQGWTTVLPAEQPTEHIALTEQLKVLTPSIAYPTVQQTRQMAAKKALKKHGYPSSTDTVDADTGGGE